MFKALACVFFMAAVAYCSGAAINSASTNTAINAMSSGSDIVQNDVQNVDGANAGFIPPFQGFQGFPALSAGPAFLAHPGVPALPAFAGHPAFFGFNPYPAGFGYDNVNSQSSNTAANVMSSDSKVVQNNVQNVDSRY